MNYIIEALHQLNEMSQPQKKIGDNLLDIAEEKLNHLIYCFLFRNSKYLKHWEIEVHAFCHKVPKQAKDNKFPTKDFILKHMAEYNDVLDSQINVDVEVACMKENNEVIVKYNRDNLLNFIHDYDNWLSQKLSLKGEVNLLEVSNKINDLLKIYSLK